MPGLIGIIDPQKKFNLTDVLLKMAVLIRGKESHSIETYIDNSKSIALARVDLGIINPEKQPIVNEDGSIITFMYGEIYDYEHIKRDLIKKDHRFLINNDPELIAHLYEELGEDFIKELNGSFIVVIYDLINQKVIIGNDKYGQRPFYYASANKHLIFSSEVRSILQTPVFRKEVNSEAIAEFITYGQLLGDKTMFKNIRVFPPASLMVFNMRNQEFNLYNYWNVINILKSEEAAGIECLEKISHLFTQGVNRMLSGERDVAVGLSGGSDSRAIIASIDKRFPLKSVTMGVRGGLDEKITRLVAKQVLSNLSFYALESDMVDKYYDYENDVVIKTDGMFGSYGVLPLYASEKYHNDGVKIILQGNAGELFKLDRAYQFKIDEYTSGRKDNNNFLKYISKKMNLLDGKIDKTKLFNKTIFKIVNEAPINSLKSISDDCADLTVGQKITYIFINELFRRSVVPSLAIIRNKVEVRLPFMDNDFLEAGLKIAPGFRTNYAIHKYIIKKNNPELLKIFMSQPMIKIGAGKIETYLYSISYRVLNKLGLNNYISPEKYVRENIQKDFFEKVLLDEKTISHNYYNPTYVKELISRYSNGDRNLFTILEPMVVMELFLRNYYD